MAEAGTGLRRLRTGAITILVLAVAVGLTLWRAERRVGRAVHAEGVPSTPLEQSVRLRVDGPYRHPALDVAFPERAAGFRRSGIDRYDEEGHDVGIGYDAVAAAAPVAFTVYLYPRLTPGERRPEPLRDHVDRAVEEVSKAHGPAREVFARDLQDAWRGETLEGRVVELEVPAGPLAATRGVVAVRVRGSWWIKYRVSAPAPLREAALARVEGLLAALGLPPLGLPP